MNATQSPPSSGNSAFCILHSAFIVRLHGYAVNFHPKTGRWGSRTIEVVEDRFASVFSSENAAREAIQDVRALTDHLDKVTIHPLSPPS